nr:MAG TPA: hypothetical protein [Caudoviricetes sp.]
MFFVDFWVFFIYFQILFIENFSIKNIEKKI